MEIPWKRESLTTGITYSSMLDKIPPAWNRLTMAKWEKSGERIRELRNKYGVTLEELAAKSGVSCSSLSRIERGEQRVREDQIRRIAASFRYSMSEFYSDDKGSKN